MEQKYHIVAVGKLHGLVRGILDFGDINSHVGCLFCGPRKIDSDFSFRWGLILNGPQGGLTPFILVIFDPQADTNFHVCLF